jgi:hypothetical protein
MTEIPLRKAILYVLWRQINLQFWKQKLGIIIATSLVANGLQLALHRFLMGELSDIVPTRTAFLDRPCDNAVLKTCQFVSFRNTSHCLGQSHSYTTPTDKAENWEVKLQLVSTPAEGFPVAVLEVYGATDSVCKELGFDVVSPQRTKWPWQGMRSWGDIWADYIEDSQPKTESGVSIFPNQNSSHNLVEAL